MDESMFREIEAANRMSVAMDDDKARAMIEHKKKMELALIVGSPQAHGLITGE